MLIPFPHRLIAILLYMIPLSQSMPFGRYLFIDFPFLQWIIVPSLPIIYLQQIIPFGGLLLFLFLFFVIAKNPRIPYFLRFNSMQVILLNIALIIMSYIFEILFKPFQNSLLIETFSSTVLITILGIVIFSTYKCLEGKEPDLPIFSNAARIQL